MKTHGKTLAGNQMFEHSTNRNNTASSRKRGMEKPNAANRKRMEKESRRINRRRK